MRFHQDCHPENLYIPTVTSPKPCLYPTSKPSMNKKNAQEVNTKTPRHPVKV